MSRRWLIILPLLLTGMSLSAARILTVNPTTAQAGQPVAIKYKSAPACARVEVYTTTSRVPLMKRITVQSGMPTATYRDTIAPGEYIVRCSTDSAVLDSVRLTVLPEPWEGETRIGLIADIHLMAPELLVSEGTAYDKDVMQNRKMLHLSAPVWQALVDTMAEYMPDFLLIAGDLTKDGEYVSHEQVIAGLKRLDSLGIQTFVIPGNHDVDSKIAYRYDGTKREAVANCSAEDFRELYADYGYDTTRFEVDSASLSYVVQLTDSLVLIGIDNHDGTVDARTMQWISDRADSIAVHHLHAIAMSHYQVLNHFNEQDRFVPSSLLSNADSVAYILTTHGVHVVLTGHLHITDATKDYPGLLFRDSLWEIATGSPLVFPCHYRMLSYTDSTSRLQVQTRLLRQTDSVPDLQQYACRWSMEKMQTMIPYLTERMWQRVEPLLSALGTTRLFKRLYERLPQTSQERTALVNRYLQQPLTDIYLTHCEADETRFYTDDLKTSVYAGIDSITAAVIGDTVFASWQKTLLETSIRGTVRAVVGPPLTSVLGDVSNYLTTRSNVMPDLSGQVVLPEVVVPELPVIIPDTVPSDTVPTDPDAVEYILQPDDNGLYYDILGRPVSRPEGQSGTIYIRNKTKIIQL